MREQVDALRQAGHEVDVELLSTRLGLIGVIRNHIRYIAANRRVKNRVREGGYDVIHAHSGSSALAALAASKYAPLVVTHHGEQVYASRWGGIPFLRPVDRFAMRRACRAIVVSKRLQHIHRATRPSVIPCGVAPGFFAAPDRTAARARLGFTDDVSYVLFPADPTRTIKNHARFAQVIDELRSRGRAVEGVALSELGLERADVPIAFAAHDVLLMTSDSEGSPQVVKEALAARLPVVSTDVGDVAASTAGVIPGGVVALVDSEGLRSESVIVSRLADLVEAVLERGGRSDSDRVSDRYSNPTIVRRLTEEYEAAIADSATT